jgi:hypothetical protein
MLHGGNPLIVLLLNATRVLGSADRIAKALAVLLSHRHELCGAGP